MVFSFPCKPYTPFFVFFRFLLTYVKNVAAFFYITVQRDGHAELVSASHCEPLLTPSFPRWDPETSSGWLLEVLVISTLILGKPIQYLWKTASLLLGWRCVQPLVNRCERNGFRAIYNLCFSVYLWYSWNIVLKLLYNSAIKVFPLRWKLCSNWWNVHSNRWNVRSNGWNVRSKPWNILFIVDKKLFQCS